MQRWNEICKQEIVDRTKYTQVRVRAIAMVGGDGDTHISLREFSRFTTREEKAIGLRREDVAFKPTDNGITFNAKKIDDVINALQNVKHSLCDIIQLCK